MSRTAVGLFENPMMAEQVANDLEASGFPRNNVRILHEPMDMPVTGVMSTPRTEFRVGLNRDLRKIGATDQEANAYVQGVRREGVLVFASGPDEKIEAAAEIMNRQSPVEVEELTGGELDLPSITGETRPRSHECSVLTGQSCQAGGGARMFSW
jgi:hypothetical protein